MHIVPHLIWLGTTIDQRYELLVEVGDVAIEAAAWAISQQAYDLALEWLEEGRSIVWNQMLQLRTPFDQISSINLSLAQRLEEVARQLDNAASSSHSALTPLTKYPSNLGQELEAQHHRQLADEWDRLLQQVRNIPGFQDFMRPRKAAVLMCAANNGPIAVINVHPSRCDALIIQPNSGVIDHVPLKSFSQDKALNVRGQIAPLIGRQGIDPDTRHIKPRQHLPEQPFAPILAALWSDIAKPILDFLGYTASVSTIPNFVLLTFCFRVSLLPTSYHI